MSVKADDVVAAIQLLVQAGIAYEKLSDVYRSDLTVDDVKAIIDQTDVTIGRLKEED